MALSILQCLKSASSSNEYIQKLRHYIIQKIIYSTHFNKFKTKCAYMNVLWVNIGVNEKRRRMVVRWWCSIRDIYIKNQLITYFSFYIVLIKFRVLKARRGVGGNAAFTDLPFGTNQKKIFFFPQQKKTKTSRYISYLQFVNCHLIIIYI